MGARAKFPKKIINAYLEKIRRQIAVEGVLLFGSHAYGMPNKHSDVDLAIISSDFQTKIKDRLFWLSWQREGVATSIAMDVIGYTPEEFERIEEESAIMSYAKKHGKWLYRAE
ncbi:MAG: nucleotidyltransferase domain-containing protein [Patescibacteria group bacterium]